MRGEREGIAAESPPPPAEMEIFKVGVKEWCQWPPLWRGGWMMFWPFVWELAPHFCRMYFRKQCKGEKKKKFPPGKNGASESSFLPQKMPYSLLLPMQHFVSPEKSKKRGTVGRRPKKIHKSCLAFSDCCFQLRGNISPSLSFSSSQWRMLMKSPPSVNYTVFSSYNFLFCFRTTKTKISGFR